MDLTKLSREELLAVAEGRPLPGAQQAPSQLDLNSLDREQLQAVAEGKPMPEKAGLGSVLGRGTDLYQSSLFRALQGYGAGRGLEGLEYLGQEGAQRNIEEANRTLNPERLLTWDEAEGLSGVGRYALEQGLLSAPGMAGTLAGSGVGAVLGGVPGALIGGTLTSYPQLYGGNIQAQIDENGEITDNAKAAIAAVGQAGLESLFSEIPLGKVAGRFIGPGLVAPLTKVGRSLEQNLVPRVIKNTAEGALGEGSTEAAQQVLQRWQAGQDLLSDEAYNDYKMSFIGGALVGGPLAGGFSVFTKPDADPNDPEVLRANAAAARLSQDEEVKQLIETLRSSDNPAERQQGIALENNLQQTLQISQQKLLQLEYKPGLAGERPGVPTREEPDLRPAPAMEGAPAGTMSDADVASWIDQNAGSLPTIQAIAQSDVTPELKQQAVSRYINSADFIKDLRQIPNNPIDDFLVGRQARKEFERRPEGQRFDPRTIPGTQQQIEEQIAQEKVDALAKRRETIARNAEERRLAEEEAAAAEAARAAEAERRQAPTNAMMEALQRFRQQTTEAQLPEQEGPQATADAALAERARQLEGFSPFQRKAAAREYIKNLPEGAQPYMPYLQTVLDTSDPKVVNDYLNKQVRREGKSGAVSGFLDLEDGQYVRRNAPSEAGPENRRPGPAPGTQLKTPEPEGLPGQVRMPYQPTEGGEIYGIPKEYAERGSVRLMDYPYEAVLPRRAAHQQVLIEETNKAHRNARPERLAIADLVTDQDAIDNRLKGPSEGPVFVERIGGVNHLRDGNHRVEAAARAGSSHVDALVADMDPVVALNESLRGGITKAEGRRQASPALPITPPEIPAAPVAEQPAAPKPAPKPKAAAPKPAPKVVEPAPEVDEEIDYDEHPLMKAHEERTDEAVDAIYETENSTELRKLAKKYLRDDLIDDDGYSNMDEAIREAEREYKHEEGQSALEDAVREYADNKRYDIEAEIDEAVQEERDFKAAQRRLSEPEEMRVLREEDIAPPPELGLDETAREQRVAEEPTAEQPAAEEGPKLTPEEVAKKQETARKRLNEIMAEIKGRGPSGRIFARAFEEALKDRRFTPAEVYHAYLVADTATTILRGTKAMPNVTFVKTIKSWKTGKDSPGTAGTYAAPNGPGVRGAMQFAIREDIGTPGLRRETGAFKRESAAHETFHLLQDLINDSDPEMSRILFGKRVGTNETGRGIYEGGAFFDGMTLADVDPTVRNFLERHSHAPGGDSYWQELVDREQRLNEQAKEKAKKTGEPVEPNPMHTQREMMAYIFGNLADARLRGVSLGNVKPVYKRMTDFLVEFKKRLASKLRGDGYRSINDILQTYADGKRQQGYGSEVVIQRPGQREAMMVSEGAETFSPEMKKKAEEMEAKGVDPDIIWVETGLTRAPYDDKWRAEVPDIDSTLGPGLDGLVNDEKAKLGDVLLHDELYKAYPWLKDVEVISDPRLDSGEGSYFDGQIKVSSIDAFGALRGKTRLHADELRNVLIHEIQHAVQKSEELFGGANNANAINIIAKNARRIADGRLRKLDDKVAAFVADYVDLTGRDNLYNRADEIVRQVTGNAEDSVYFPAINGNIYSKITATDVNGDPLSDAKQAAVIKALNADPLTGPLIKATNIPFKAQEVAGYIDSAIIDNGAKVLRSPKYEPLTRAQREDRIYRGAPGERESRMSEARLKMAAAELAKTRPDFSKSEFQNDFMIDILGGKPASILIPNHPKDPLRQYNKRIDDLRAKHLGAEPEAMEVAEPEAMEVGDETAADRLSKRLDEIGFVPRATVEELMGAKRPKYLGPVIKFMAKQRKKTIAGKLTPRDILKAWTITVGSQGANAIYADTIYAKTGFDVPAEFREASGKVRPEEAMAAWLETPAGQRALNSTVAGNPDMDAWEDGFALRRAYGDDRYATARFVNSLGDLKAVTDKVNAAKGDASQITKAVQELNGIGNVKREFIKFMLGFGDTPTIDAVEINFWLTGKGDISKLRNERADFVRDVKKSGSSFMPELINRIRQQMADMREQIPALSEIPEEFYYHVLHHWIWDKAKGVETTHRGSMRVIVEALETGEGGNELIDAIRVVPTNAQINNANAAANRIIGKVMPTQLGNFRTIGQMTAALSNAINHFFSPYKMQAKGDYRRDRYIAIGKIQAATEKARIVWNAMKNATPEHKRAVYNYLTTKGAAPPSVPPALRAAAISAKAQIGDISKMLLDRKLISQDEYDKWKDAYLPQLYMEYLTKPGAGGLIRGGLTPSDMNYLKQRLNLPLDLKIAKAPVTDPAFLSLAAILVPQRDMVLLDFMGDIAKRTDVGWVLPDSMVKWRGRNVSPLWAAEQADTVRRQAVTEPDASRKRLMLKVAGELQALVDNFQNPEIPKGYVKMPNSPIYGPLAGVILKKEIRDDLVGIGGPTADMDGFEKMFGQRGLAGRATSIWKYIKTVLSPSAQFRQVISNVVMLGISGVNVHQVPNRLLRAIKTMKDGEKDEYYRIGQKYGVGATGMVSQELYSALDEMEASLKLDAKLGTINIPAFHAATKNFLKVVEAVKGGAEKSYDLGDTLFKYAKIIDEMERSKPNGPETKQQREDREWAAADQAHKWFLDYSEVPSWIKSARSSVIGAPFITYYYKVAPLMLEVFLTKPWRLWPAVALYYGAYMAASAAFGADDDDIEKLRKVSQDYIAKNPNALPVPFIDEEGRPQLLDVGYLYPWQMFVNIATAAGGAISGKGSATDVITATGMLGSPVLSVGAAMLTNTDPFTDKKIVNEYDPMATQFWDRLTYAWGVVAPPFLAANGSVPQLFNRATGEDLGVDRKGQPKLATSQLIARLFGINLYPIDPEYQRAQRLSAMMYDLNQTKSRLSYRLKDLSLPPDERAEIAKEGIAEIQRRAREIEKFARETEIPEQLRVRRGE